MKLIDAEHTWKIRNVYSVFIKKYMCYGNKFSAQLNLVVAKSHGLNRQNKDLNQRTLLIFK
jgi:hypothetical protein